MISPVEQLSFDGMAPSLTASVTIRTVQEVSPLPFHPLADLFPLLEGPEFAELVADIQQHGVLEPMWLYEGQVLDGRNRYRACQALGIDCPSRIYDGNDPLEFVLSLNLRRRHLTESQRGMVAARLATLEAHRPTKTVGIPTLSQSQAAERLNISRQTVIDARKVQQQGASELTKAIDDGDMTIAAALPLTALSKDAQPQALDEAKRVASGKKVTAAVTASVVQQRQGVYAPAASLPPNGQAPEPAPIAVEATPVPTLDTLFSTASAALRSLEEALRFLTLEERIAARPDAFRPQLLKLLTLLGFGADAPTPPVKVPHPKPVSSHKGRKKTKKRSAHTTKAQRILAAARTMARFRPADVSAITKTTSHDTSNVLRLAVKRETVIHGQRLEVDPVTDEYVWVAPASAIVGAEGVAS